MSYQVKSVGSVNPVSPMPGFERRTLTYDADSMLCHFTEKKDAQVPMHTHEAAQVGYVLHGKVKFFTGDGDEFIASAGDAYSFTSMYPHGSIALEDSELIEFFMPCREDYLP